MDTLLENIKTSDTYYSYQGNKLKDHINNYKELNNIESMNTQSNTELLQLDIKFKNLLSKYTQALHSVNEELLKNTQTVNYNLLGKRFVTNKVDMYINPYGYGHNYTEHLEENPSCPSKTDIFNNSCQGFSNTYLTKSNGSNKYMHFKNYKLKEGFVEQSLLDKLKSCSNEDVANLKENYKQYYSLYFPNLKIDEKRLDNIILMHKQKCTRDEKDKHKHLTLNEAKLKCNKKSSCKGFTFNGNPKHSNNIILSSNASINLLEQNTGWHTYLKDGDWGCAPEFSKNWWVENKCTTNPETNSKSICNTDLKEIKNGYNMTNNIPCKIAGKLVRNIQDNELAWVDMQGIKHVFPDTIMQDKLDGCNTKITISLKSDEYNAIPLGEPMNKESICQHINIDDRKYKHLLKLNKQLESTAHKMLLKLDSIISKDINTEQDIMSKKSSIKSLLEKIKTERKIVDKKTQQDNIIYKQLQDSHTVYMSNNYHMIAWGLLVLAFSGITIPLLLK